MSGVVFYRSADDGTFLRTADAHLLLNAAFPKPGSIGHFPPLSGRWHQLEIAVDPGHKAASLRSPASVLLPAPISSGLIVTPGS